MANALEPLTGLVHRLQGPVSRHKTAKTSGLHIVHDVEDAVFDIVAVYRIGGSGFPSWTTTGDSRPRNSRPWLEQLAKDMPNARIIAYRYFVDDDFDFGCGVRNLVRRRALYLADALSTLRHDDKTNRRPLFFVAHCMGIWIVKHLLIISSEAATAPELKDLELSTSGIISFWTASVSPPSSVATFANATAVETSEQTYSHDVTSFRSQEPNESDMKQLQQDLEPFKAIAPRLHQLSFGERKVGAECEVQQPDMKLVTDGSRTERQLAEHDPEVLWGRDDDYRIFVDKFRSIARQVNASTRQNHISIGCDIVGVHQQQYSSLGYSIPSKLPSVCDSIVDRQDLLGCLDQMLLGDQKESVATRYSVVNIWGPAGTGKSTIAMRYAETNRARFSFAYWLQAESWETVVASYLELASTIVDFYTTSRPRSKVESDLGFVGLVDTLKIRSIVHLDVSRVKSLVRAVQDWLLRPDNVGWLLVFDNADASYDISDFVPITLNGNIILTSRRCGRCPWGENLTVRGMTEEEAVGLLASLEEADGAVPGRDQTLAAIDLVRRLNLHAQDIAITAATIRNRGLTIAEYQHLTQTPASSFDTAPSTSPSSSLSTSCASSQPSTLFDYFIVEPNAREQVRAALTEDEKVGCAWMPCSMRVDGIRSRGKRASALPDIYDMDKIIASHAVTCYNDWAPILEAAHEHHSIAWHVLGQACIAQGALEQAIGCFELCLRQDMDESNADERAETALCLSLLLQRVGRYDRCSQVLDGIEPKSVGQPLSFRIALARASILADQGDLKGAEARYRTSVLELEAAFGANDPLTVEAVHQLALTLEKLDKPDEAQSLYRRVHISNRNLYGPHDRSTFDALDAIAKIYEEGFALDEAEGLYKQSWDMRTRALGANHPSTAYAMQRLAMIDDFHGRYPEAQSKYEQILTITAPVLGRSHPVHTMAMENLALSCRNHAHTLAKKPRAKPPSTCPLSSLKVPHKAKSILHDKQMVDTAASWHEFARAEDLYLDVLRIKTSAKGLYSQKEIKETAANLVDMYYEEDFFDDTQAGIFEALGTVLQKGRDGETP